MQRCFGDLCYSSVLIYLDDIIVFSRDFASHLLKLDLVFSRLKEYGLILKPSKCHILQQEVQYLGHRVSAAGVSVDPEKVSTVQGWKEPSTVKEVRAFLGFTCFFRRFVQGYASIAAPLFCLLKTGPGVKKGKRGSVLGSQKVTLDEDVLAYADFQKSFCVETNASGSGLGAILMQEDATGNNHVIAYASRTLRPTERSGQYSTFKLELLAVKWAVTEAFRDYLLGQKCTIVTDHHPLLFLDKANLGCTELRWVQRMSSFGYEIKYRPGKENQGPDVLSRLDPPDGMDTGGPSTVASTTIQATFGLHLPAIEVPHSLSSQIRVCREGGTSSLPGYTSESLKEHQEGDEIVRTVREFVGREFRPNREERGLCPAVSLRLLRDWKSLSLRDGVLVRKVQSPKDATDHFQIVLPQDLQEEVLTRFHDETGHFGARRVYRLLADSH